MVEPSGATSSGWSTNGTGLGINSASGFTGNLLDLQNNGTQRLNVTATGLVQFNSTGTSGVQSHASRGQIYLATNLITSGNGDLAIMARQGYGIGFGVSAANGTTNTIAMSINNTGFVGIGLGLTNATEMLQIRGANATDSRIILDSYGTGVTSHFVGRSSRGTASVPTASQANDTLAMFSARGYGTSLGTVNRANISMKASENWTGSAQGTYMAFSTTANGGTTTAEKWRIDNAGGFTNTGGVGSALIHAVSTTEQMRLGYDTSNYFKTTVGSTGSTTFALVGTSPTFTFSQDITAPNITASGNVVMNGATSVLKLKSYTVATLPAGTQGDMAYVTDALAPAYNAVVVGGGAVTIPVFYNGVAWTAH